MRSVKDVQTALMARGFSPGPLDGIAGRLTRAAIARFQVAHDLPSTGIADDRTLSALFPDEQKPKTAKALSAPWYLEALRLKGLREAPGAANSPVIMGWAKRLGGWVASFYKADSIPWCGLAMAHFIGSTLPKEPLPANPLSALAWNTFGMKLSKPVLGAILVFKRAGGGHVGLYAGEDAEAYHVLGGNQADSINISRIAKSRLVGIRWPDTAPLPSGGPIPVTAVGELSTNEA